MGAHLQRDGYKTEKRKMKKWEPNPEELEKNQKKVNEKMGPTFDEVDKNRKIQFLKVPEGPASSQEDRPATQAGSNPRKK